MEIMQVSPINLTLTLNAADTKEVESATQVLTTMGVKWDIMRNEVKEFVVDLRLTLSEINDLCDAMDCCTIEIRDEKMKPKARRLKDFFAELDRLSEAYTDKGAIV